MYMPNIDNGSPVDNPTLPTITTDQMVRYKRYQSQDHLQRRNNVLGNLSSIDVSGTCSTHATITGTSTSPQLIGGVPRRIPQ